MTTTYPGAIDSFTTKVDGPVNPVMAAHVNDLQDAVVAAQTAIGEEGNPGLCEGRLTLTTAVPVTTADVTAATTIYFTPFMGNRVSLHNGTGWITHKFTERSLSLSGFTLGKNNDVFLYNNAGTLTLERVEWTNNTTRATALATQDGIYIKSGDTTRRYLGTFRTTGTTGQTEDSLLARYVWNYYHRKSKNLKVSNATSHTYDSATVRAFNGGAMFVSGVAYVIGVAEDDLTVNLRAGCTRLITDSTLFIGIGVASNAHSIAGQLGSNFDGNIAACWAILATQPTAGYNELWITQSGGNTAGDPTFGSARLDGSVLC